MKSIQTRNLRSKSRHFLVTSAKLLVTCAVIGGIGALFLLLNPDAEIEEGMADIVATEFGPRTQTARFQDSLSALGHNEPLALELNGNRIFTSSAHYRMPPEQVLARYQQEFVRQRLNTRAWNDLAFDQAMQRDRASFSGEVVPQKVAPNHVIMNGTDLTYGAKDAGELYKKFNPMGGPGKTFSAYRWVEVIQEPGSKISTVFASWSDESFDYERMNPQSTQAARELVDDEVPVCPKCILVNQMADVGAPGYHQTYVFETSHSLEQLKTFYGAKLAQAGWQDEPGRDILQKIRNQFPTGMDQMEHLTMQRDGWAMNIMIYPTDEQLYAVKVQLSDDIYQQSLAESAAQ